MTLLLAALTPSAWAFNPPTDQVGPVRVRIDGPTEVASLATPLSVEVIAENTSAQALTATLQLRGTDAWRTVPDGAIPVELPAHGRVARKFQVSAGPGTYDAWYPLHAWVRFTLDGQPQVAHPILVFQNHAASVAPPAAPCAWQPIDVPAAGELGLWMVPVRRAVIQVFGESPLVTAVGWHGTEPRCRANLDCYPQNLGGDVRSALTMHPPWHDRHVGTIAVEFPVRLPAAAPLVLHTALGMRPADSGDGVTFRVRVAPIDAPAGTLGTVVFERHSHAKTWTPVSVDLQPYAGRTVRLQLESHPGPKNDTTNDASYWAEPTLQIGAASPPPAFPPASAAGSKPLGTIRCGSGEHAVRIWPGPRGLLDTVIGLLGGAQPLYVRGLEVRVADAQLNDPRSPCVLQQVTDESTADGYQVRHRFTSPWGAFELVGRVWLEPAAVRVKLHLEHRPVPQPWLDVHLEDAACGRWNLQAAQVYAGQGNVLREPQAFQLPFDGHRLSTSFVGLDFAGGPSVVLGSDLPPARFEVRPADRHYALHVPGDATLTVIPAANVWDGVKSWRQINGLHAADGVPVAAGRFVFDLWGGPAAGETADKLRQAFRYGLTDALVVWHDWQRWGYDYRLPDIFPPNPKRGGLAETQALAQACRAAGVRFAPHDNYIDFYPDADDFSYDRQIAFHAPGQPVKAWFNEGRQAQSYRYRADRIEPFVRRNLPWIRDALAPSAYFIDVWSSAGPYDHWTVDGQFASRTATLDVWRRQFAWIRATLGDHAPQISESGHDQLIGWLDGAQTNALRVGKSPAGARNWTVWNIECADAERTPWADAAHHDRFILHGAGYPGRYEGGLDPQFHGIYSDDYLATEVLTGHPAMVSQAFSRDTVRKYWLLAALGRGLALHTIDGVEYAGGNLHRQHVAWSGGGQVWVNRGADDWSVAGHVLPPYGFYGELPAATNAEPVISAIERRAGLIVEHAQGGGRYYVNGRRPVDRLAQVAMHVEKVTPLGQRNFEMTLVCQADAPIPAVYAPFIHFNDAHDKIVFQPHFHLGKSGAELCGTIPITARFTIPDTLPKGNAFAVYAGFYQPHGGERLRIAHGTSQHRLWLGTLRCTQRNGALTATWEAAPAGPDPAVERDNPAGKPVDFGRLITADACCWTTRGGAPLIIPLPQPAGETFHARIPRAALPQGMPQAVEILGPDDQVLSRQAPRVDHDQLQIECPASAFACRLVAP